MNISIDFRTIEARRFTISNTANVCNNSNITSVSAIKNELHIDFVFTCNYEPAVGTIRIEGELVMEETPENVNRTMNEWVSSDKKILPIDIAEKVHKIILMNCISEATPLSCHLHLPVPPFPLPQINSDTQKNVVKNKDDCNYIR